MQNLGSIHMVITFHIARHTSLILTHQITRTSSVKNSQD